MAQINPALPVVGLPDPTEEPKIITAFQAILAQINGNLDSSNIADGSLTYVDLAASLQALVYQPGDIKLIGAAAAPTGWLACDGSAVLRATYSALFSAIGTTHGAGNGTTTFNVPDLRGRAPIGPGIGAGLTARTAGQLVSNEETHKLTDLESGVNRNGATVSYNPLGMSKAIGEGGTLSSYFTNNAGAFQMGIGAVATVGPIGLQIRDADNPHNNMQPSTVVTFVIKI